MGLAGRDSVHFYAFGAIAWLIWHVRPDIDYQLVPENSPDIQEPHREVIRRTLGVPNEFWATLPSPGPFTRRRSWVATLPPAPNPQAQTTSQHGRRLAPPR